MVFREVGEERIRQQSKQRERHGPKPEGQM